MSLDRQERLQTFVDWTTAHITGDEKGQAQIFLDRLFQAFGQRGSLDVGGTPEFRIKPGLEDQGGTSFADYVWKHAGGGVLIEMKKRGEDLTRHRQQAFNYWIKLVPNRPQYTVLCNFDEFRIYDFNIDLDEPLDTISLAELPSRYDPLNFLFPTSERPVFQNNRVEVTKKAADRLASAFYHMTHTRKVDRELAQRFILQLLVALFAEDIDLLPKNFLTNLLADIQTPEDSYDLLGGLFEAMNRQHGTPAGRFKGIRYFNGGLFAQPARIALDQDGIELAHLRNAAKENWSKVSPDIFGTLFQHSMDAGERHAFGAHYTAPIDIMKIVRPTIVEPWTQLIDSAKTPKRLADLLERLSFYTVLDPACGSGNFLYIAYRELKRLESRIRDRLRTEFPAFQATLNHVTARQFHGMDIIPFAIELAKVTMMLARKLAIDELHIADEPPLPLDNLDANFQCADALMITGAPDGNPGPSPSLPSQSNGFVNQRSADPSTPTPPHPDTPTLFVITPWPAADVIIGNPPFLGAPYLEPQKGREYVTTLRDRYPEVPGMADYCVYWFRRAHDHLPVCTPDRPESGRAGLVGTQNIRNNQSRVGGLDHIVKTGVIVEAVENQPWSGEANVHVSIANWVKTAPSSAPKAPGSAGGPSDGTTAKSQPNPAKLLIPDQKKLWFKVDPKLALFAKTKAKSAVVTTGKRGKSRVDKSYELDFRETHTINSALSDEVDVSGATSLRCNASPQRVFRGQEPGNRGFILEPIAARILRTADKHSREVVFPHVTGDDLLDGDGRPTRYIIDFGARDQLQAAAYHAAFQHVQENVLKQMVEIKSKEEEADGPRHGNKRRVARLDRWWTLRRACAETTIPAISKINRYIACSRHLKRNVFCFIDHEIRPDSAVQVFAFEDDYSFGILQSGAHWLWFVTKCGKLKADFRYHVESVFDTFPWPQSPTKKQIDAVAAAGREIRRIRAQALASMTGGLRALYRTLELPGTNPLKTAHTALDQAVLAAYNFDPKADLLAQLLALNLQVATDLEAGNPVTPPGIPPSYGHPEPLITEDCIQP